VLTKIRFLTKTVSPVKSVGASTSLPISSAIALPGKKIELPIIPAVNIAGKGNDFK